MFNASLGVYPRTLRQVMDRNGEKQPAPPGGCQGRAKAQTPRQAQRGRPAVPLGQEPAAAQHWLR